VDAVGGPDEYTRSTLVLIYLSFALAHRQRGDLAQAHHYFDNAIDAAAQYEQEDASYYWGNAKLYLCRANARAATDDAAGAVSDYEELVTRGGPCYPEKGLEFELPCPQDIELALADATYALNVIGRPELAYFARGLVRQLAGDWAGATVDLEAAAKAAPQNELLGQRVQQQKAQVEMMSAKDEEEAKQVSTYTPARIKPGIEYYNVGTDMDGGYSIYTENFTSDHKSSELHRFDSDKEMTAFQMEIHAKLVADGWQQVSSSGGRSGGTKYYQRKRSN
jgi:tetratricopeptide (TPR) repeat protein